MSTSLTRRWGIAAMAVVALAATPAAADSVLAGAFDHFRQLAQTNLALSIMPYQHLLTVHASGTVVAKAPCWPYWRSLLSPTPSGW